MMVHESSLAATARPRRWTVGAAAAQAWIARIDPPLPRRRATGRSPACPSP